MNKFFDWAVKQELPFTKSEALRALDLEPGSKKLNDTLYGRPVYRHREKGAVTIVRICRDCFTWWPVR